MTARIYSIILSIIIALGTAGCGNDDYDHLPREIQQFVNLYFPGQEVGGFNESGGSYTVNLTNSATMVFNPSLAWITIDGNGNSLPDIFLYDQFPKPLYDYTVTTDNLHNVYAVTRYGGVYTVTYHDYIIAYDVATEKISPVTNG